MVVYFWYLLVFNLEFVVFWHCAGMVLCFMVRGQERDADTPAHFFRPLFLTAGILPCAQVNRFHGKYQYMFIESICTDHSVLEVNYRQVKGASIP